MKNDGNDHAISAVMAIHDLNLASRYTDKMLMMNSGRIFAAEDSVLMHTVENIPSTRPGNFSVNRCIHDICAI